jgi:hypothetical protein
MLLLLLNPSTQGVLLYAGPDPKRTAKVPAELRVVKV